MIPIIEIFSLAANAIIGTGVTAGTLPVINTAVVTTTTTQIATTVITQNQNVNVFTSINSGGSNHLTDQMSGTMPKSKFQKILATIMKILCGLMIAIFIVNVFIYIFQLGANHLRAEMIGSGENTTKVGWFKIILRKLDILAMIGDGIGWLTEEEKVKKLSQAEADGWVELSPSQRIGPVPTFAPERYRLTAKYQKAVNLMGDGPRGSGMSQEKAAKLAGVSVPSLTAEGTFDISPELRSIRSGRSDFTDADWGKISSSSQSIAKFFGWGQKDCEQGCGKTPCGNVYIRAAHPLDVCVARAPSDTSCNVHLCKDYTYYVQLIMSRYPAWFQHLTPRAKANFHRAYVNSGWKNTSKIVTIPPSDPDMLGHPWTAGAAFDFKYIDKGEDKRWEEETLDHTQIEDDYTHSSGSTMSDLAWPNSWGGGSAFGAGICCDPYGDNQTFNCANGDPSYSIDIETNADVQAAFHPSEKEGKPNGSQQLQMACALVAPRYKAVHWDHFRFEKWGIWVLTTAHSAINKLVAENESAMENPDWNEPVHTFIDYAKLNVKGMYPKLHSTYNGVKIYANNNAAGAVAYAFAWTTIEKECACAGEAAFGAGTALGSAHQLIVGAEYKLSMKLVGKRICKDQTFTFPGEDTAENEATFLVNCGKKDGPPGDFFVNITHGYGNVGGS
jgi:hypothetical protein